MITTKSGCEFKSEQAVIDRVIEKGMQDQKLPNNFEIECECSNTITMDTHVYTCPHCEKVYGVTPCSNDDINNVVSN